MRAFFWLAILVVTLSSFIAGGSDTPLARESKSFGKGEQLDYKVNFGIFTVGKATTRIDNRIFHINQRPCYKIDAFGETSEWISWITRVKDNWGAYLDTANMSTHVSYRKIREGRHKLDELANFDHKNGKVTVKWMDQESGVYGNPREYEIPKNAKDLVGGFMLLRQIDFKRVDEGDTLTIGGFFEDTSYYLNVIYTGKETITTKIGKIPCHKLVPVMPDNKLFDGENSITCWISDDLNKIPVKIQAKMFIGHTGVELESFRGLKHQLRVIPNT